MMRRIALAVASAAALVLAGITGAQVASADAPPTVHPGMSIAMLGGPLNMPNGGSTCTVAAVGTDDQDRLLGLAAGHCIPPNEHPEVQASSSVLGITGGPVIGHWITKPTGFPGIYTDPSNQDLSRDGAFFEILPGTPVSNQLPNGTRINAIESNGPGWLQHHCKYGQTTGTTCGWVTKTGSPFESTAGVLPGDSGGPAYTASWPNQPTGKLLGVASAMFPNRFSDITNILVDAATQGITGFTPLP